MNTPNDIVSDIESRITDVQRMAKNGITPDEILKYLVSECGLMEKAQLMVVFHQGFEAALGNVSCIGGWWINDEGELGDSEINELLQPVLKNYAANK